MVGAQLAQGTLTPPYRTFPLDPESKGWERVK
jgi:hypothetical protein